MEMELELKLELKKRELEKLRRENTRGKKRLR
jgi:hypothetical protein